jgi:phosphate transport system protein
MTVPSEERPTNEAGEGHTVRGYDVDLTGLRMKLLEMGGLVLDQVQLAVRALVESDAATARTVLAREEEVNAYDTRIDEGSIALIARRQPMGSDLRVIISIARAVNDLERVGDEAKKIARYVAGVGDPEAASPPIPQLARDARNMARHAASMLREALDGFDRMDPHSALELSRRDAELNAEFQAALRRLVTYAMEDPRLLHSIVAAVFVLKALERVGDHAKNIARHVVYVVQGLDVRHEDTAVLAAIDRQAPTS